MEYSIIEPRPTTIEGRPNRRRRWSGRRPKPAVESKITGSEAGLELQRYCEVLCVRFRTLPLLLPIADSLPPSRRPIVGSNRQSVLRCEID